MTTAQKTACSRCVFHCFHFLNAKSVCSLLSYFKHCFKQVSLFQDLITGRAFIHTSHRLRPLQDSMGTALLQSRSRICPLKFCMNVAYSNMWKPHQLSFFFCSAVSSLPFLWGDHSGATLSTETHSLSLRTKGVLRS